MKKISCSKIILFCFFVLIFISCSRGKDTLQFNLVNETIQLDWNMAVDPSSIVILDNLMEGLTSYAESLKNSRGAQLRPMPALAASWTVLDGGKRYRFHLRKNVFWTDGEVLRAQHFVDSWKRLLDPLTKSEASYHLYDIIGAKEFAEEKIKDFSSVGIKAIDDSTLEVLLKYPAPYFLHLVATVNTYPIRIDLIEKYGTNWTSKENLVTLGAYALSSIIPGDSIGLKANTNYWMKEEISIPYINCKMVSEPVTALALYENNELDILPKDLPPSYISFWQKHPHYKTGPKLSVSYLIFPTNKKPFDTQAARKSFARAIQRERLAVFLKGSHSATSAWIPPAMNSYIKEIGLQFENQKTSTLRGKEVLLRYSGSDNWNLVFQSLQKMVKENIGLQLRLDPVNTKDYRSFLSEINSGKKNEMPHILHLGWAADYPDEHSFMNVFTSSSDSNYTDWRNEHYDALIEKAVSLENEEARKTLYTEAQKILLEDEMVLIPLFHASHQVLVKPLVHGVTLNSLDKWYFKNLKFVNIDETP